jgi:uncharacterized protein (DUF1015 family)
MAEPLNDVRAFRGLCYDPAAVGSVADCLAQPYDVVSPEERAAYLRRHGRNIVSLTLPLGDAPYARARADLDAWIAQGILSSAAQPALWLYQQGFAVDGRQRESRGLLAVVRLRDFSERRILPHEKVMAAPVEDRFRLTLRGAPDRLRRALDRGPAPRVAPRRCALVLRAGPGGRAHGDLYR